MENGQTERLRVLLAEDNPVTQDLLVYLLENNGHSVTTAADGKMAVEAWEKGGYDLILMDVQMPEMDGIEATNIIREKEKKTGGHTPIIAVTAYALDECKKSCSSVGMDDFISKPINVRELSAKLENFSRSRTIESLASFPEEADADENGGKPYDLSSVREIVANNEAEVRTLVRTFIEVMEERLGEMEEAAFSGDSKKARAAAHTIKGMSSQFGAENVRRISHEIELEAGAGRTGIMKYGVENLKAAFQAVKEGLLAEFGAND